MVDGGGKVGAGLGNPVLRVHLIDIDVGADVVGYFQVHGSVVGVCGHHVKHVVHAIHLLLQRRCDRLFDCECIGARVGGGDIDLRGNDIRQHRGRQLRHCNEPGNHGENGNHDSNDGAVDEKLSHGYSPPWTALACVSLKAVGGTIIPS